MDDCSLVSLGSGPSCYEELLLCSRIQAEQVCVCCHSPRFQTVDDRCAMELDDVDPSSWARLQAAVQEFCIANSARFEELGALLCPPIQSDPIDASIDAVGGDEALDTPQPGSEELGALSKDSIR